MNYKQLDPALYATVKPHLRFQRTRLAWVKFRNRIEDQAGALVLLFAVLLILLIEVSVVSILNAVQVFTGMLTGAFILLLVEAATTISRDWRKKGRR